MKFLLRDSIVASLFYFTTFFFWITFIVPLEQDFLQTSGSLLYLPAAGRILPVLFFGIKTIPTLFLSSLIAWNFFWPYELYEFRNLGLLISYFAIFVAWLMSEPLPPPAPDVILSFPNINSSATLPPKHIAILALNSFMLY